MSLLHISLSSPPTNPQSFSSLRSFSQCPISLPTLTTKLSNPTFKITPIRMGGGPRTFPGGVSKWQWKRMQREKSKQLLKARLARERQIYEMRKRAELKAAVSELERPWEAVEKPPNLFSVSADDQLKVLADRFQKPGGLDLWSERDGPELFLQDNGLPSARFFPKGVVHSVRPYGKVAELGTGLEEKLVVGEGSRVRVEEMRGESVRKLRGDVSDDRLRGSGGDLSGGRSNGRGNERTYSSNLEKINRLITRGGNEGEDMGSELLRNEYHEKSRTKGGNVSGFKSRSFGGNLSEGKIVTRVDWRRRNDDLERGGRDEAVVVQRNGDYSNSRTKRSSLDLDGGNVSGVRSRSSGGSSSGSVGEGRGSMKGNRRAYSSDSEMMNHGNGSFSKYGGRNQRHDSGAGEFRRSRGYQKGDKRNSEVFDMSLQRDGSYEVKLEN